MPTYATPSAVCNVNGSAIPLASNGTTGVSVTGGSTVTIALANVAGVNSWNCFCSITDGYNANSSTTTINNTIVKNVNGQSLTFVAPTKVGSVGCSMQWTSIVNNAAIGTPGYVTFGIFIPNTGGLRLFFNGETFESNSKYGCAWDLNQVMINGGSGGSVTWAGDLAGSTSSSQTVVSLTGTSVGGSNNVIAVTGTNTDPAGNPASGSYCWNINGALKNRGVGGATTTVAACGQGTVNTQVGNVWKYMVFLRTASTSPTTVLTFNPGTTSTCLIETRFVAKDLVTTNQYAGYDATAFFQNGGSGTPTRLTSGNTNLGTSVSTTNLNVFQFSSSTPAVNPTITYSASSNTINILCTSNYGSSLDWTFDIYILQG